jgi:phage replication O-like protein O
MANPQPNEFTKLSNELLEAICNKRISGREFQLFLFIIRRTYGFNKKSDSIALSQFSEATGIGESNIPGLLTSLEQKNMILKNKNGYISRYSVQKDYEKWKDLVKNDREKVKKQIVKNDYDLVENDCDLVKNDRETPIEKDRHNRKKESFKETIKEREIIFKNMMDPYMEKYPRELLVEFYYYWTEPHINKKKLRWEVQEFFDVGRRLGTFKRNADKRSKQYGNRKQQISEEQRIKLAAAKKALFENDKKG